jgi:hypothetical protein
MSVVENMKNLADQAKSTGQIELYKQLSEAEDAVREIARDKLRLQDRVEELERALRFKEEVVFKRPFYYLKQGDQTPYCPRCWEKDKQAVHVVVIWSEQGETRFDCPDCKSAYKVGSYRSQSHSQIESDTDIF